jgi:predicted membrane protein
METKGTRLLGIVLIVLGLALLTSTLTGIDLGVICWPSGLILLGVWFTTRPFMITPDTELEQRLLGNIERQGNWTLRAQEYWVGIGDVRLDLSNAQVPLGETTVRIFGFVGSVKVTVPKEIGIRVVSTAALTDAQVLERQKEQFFGTFEASSEVQERQVRIQSTWLVCDLEVRRV